jgi:predicted DNA-binding WGR domain protein
MAFLTRTDAARNTDRFYIMQVMPTLFGDLTIVREWGRRGSPRTVRITNRMFGLSGDKIPTYG